MLDVLNQDSWCYTMKTDQPKKKIEIIIFHIFGNFSLLQWVWFVTTLGKRKLICIYFCIHVILQRHFLAIILLRSKYFITCYLLEHFDIYQNWFLQFVFNISTVCLQYFYNMFSIFLQYACNISTICLRYFCDIFIAHWFVPLLLQLLKVTWAKLIKGAKGFHNLGFWLH